MIPFLNKQHKCSSKTKSVYGKIYFYGIGMHGYYYPLIFFTSHGKNVLDYLYLLLLNTEG